MPDALSSTCCSGSGSTPLPGHRAHPAPVEAALRRQPAALSLTYPRRVGRMPYSVLQYRVRYTFAIRNGVPCAPNSMGPAVAVGRACPGFGVLACCLILCALLSFRVQTDISPLPDPVVDNYLNEITKPERVFRVESSTPTKGNAAVQTIKVFGSISDNDIRSLVQLSGYHRQSVYSIIGDARYARVRAGTFCGRLCGSGTDLVFRRDPSGWTICTRMSGSADQNLRRTPTPKR